jgi:probable O-glycosylation ligase (exosortase A-associated)
MADAKYELVRISKILFMTFVIMLVTTSEQRLKWVFLVTAFSFGLLALKGALFGAATGGQFRVFGPPDSFISENNAFGLALNMCLPIFYFLGRVEKSLVMRRALNIGLLCSLICVILTYSRGGFLGLAAVLAALAWRSKYRMLGAIFLIVCALAVVSFAPPQWFERMGTLRQEGVDSSAQQRLVSWGTTWNFVQDYPLMGGSFYALPDVNVFQKYQTRPLPGGFLSSGPHSIYFQVLGEQGFVGFVIYFGIVISCLLTLFQLRRRTKMVPELGWISVYADIISTSLVGFLVSGAFLGFADFDLYYQMVACVCILKLLFRREAAAYQAARVPTHSTLEPGEEFA